MRINQENKSMDIERRDINYILPAYVRSYLFYTKNEMPDRIIFPMFPSVTITTAPGQSIEIPIEYVPPLDPVATEIAEDGKSVPEVTPAQEAALDEKDEEIKRLKAEVEALTQTERGGEERDGTQSAPICGAYAEHWKEIGKPEGWKGCSLPKGHEGDHTDEPITPAPEDLLRQQQESEPQVDENYEAAVADVGLKGENAVSPAKAAFAATEPKKPATPARQPRQPPGGDIGTGLPLSDMQARDRRDLARTAKDLQEGPEIDEEKEKEFEKTVSRDEHGKPVVEE